MEEQIDIKEIQKPQHIKILMVDDIIKHCKTNKRLITKDLFVKQGFSTLEINWIKKDKGDIIKMENENIINTYKERIKELEDNLKNKTTKTKTKKDYIETKEHFIYQIHDNGSTNKIRIDKKHVDELYKIIQLLTNKKNPTTTYQDIIHILLPKNNLNISKDAFNGGKNRKTYFKLYYYPLKILELQNKIKHKRISITIL